MSRVVAPLGNGAASTAPRWVPAPAALLVPFVDLRPQHEELRAEIEAAIREIIDRSSFVGGEAVEAFEAEFAAYCGVRHAVGVGSGTEALRLALAVVGVASGDVVVTVAHTFMATAGAASQLGAIPAFVDVEPGALTMDPEALARFFDAECVTDAHGELRQSASGRRIAAVVPVHLYGQSAELAPILELCGERGIPVVEDACQAHGATYRAGDLGERRCGSLGRVGVFSFYPGKNLGALGEAGALVTDDAALAERTKLLRDHGQRERYRHESALGGNGRLDTLQAAVLRLKLNRLDAWNERRRAAARRYHAWLQGTPLGLPVDAGRGRHVYHLFVVRSPERDRLRSGLAAAGITAGLHYPLPLHLQPAYASLGYSPGSLPVTEAAAASVLSLPLYPHITDAQIDRVSAEVLNLTRV